MFDSWQFTLTMDMNRDKIVRCHFCNKTENLIKAHHRKWKYRDRIRGFICPDCFKEYKED